MRSLIFLLLIGCAIPPPEAPTTLQAIPTALAANPPASTSSPTPAAALTTPATQATKGCATILSVEKQEVFTGFTRSARRNMEASGGSGKQVDDHGLLHVRCTYQIKIKGALYKFQEDIGGLISGDSTKDFCELQRSKQEEHINAFTLGCTDLKRGEYYDSFFTPLAP